MDPPATLNPMGNLCWLLYYTRAIGGAACFGVLNPWYFFYACKGLYSIKQTGFFNLKCTCVICLVTKDCFWT